MQSSEESVAACTALVGGANGRRAGRDEILVGQFAVSLQVMAKRAADIGKGHVVDRRARHERIDAFEVGQVVKPGFEDPMWSGRTVETCGWRERGGATGSERRSRSRRQGKRQLV